MNANGLIVWFTRHPVAANLLMSFIIVAGIFSFWSIRKEFIPEIDLDTIRVTIEYPGAAPDEVERAVCIPVEEALYGIDGVKHINSVASGGIGEINVQVTRTKNSRRVLDDIKMRVDAIDSFPEETKKAIIEETIIRQEVMWIVLSASLSERELKNLAERVHDEIMELGNISQIEIYGINDEEISVEVSEENMRRYGLTFENVADAVRLGSIDLPGGRIKSDNGEILLRSQDRVTTAGKIADILLQGGEDGTRVTVGNVAKIHDGFTEDSSFVRMQGKPAVALQIFRTGNQSTLAIAETVKKYLNTKKSSLPIGVDMVVVNDSSEMLKDRLYLMIKNITLGGILVFFCLALFLRMKIAFWVMVGLPISFLGTIWLMSLPVFNISINMVSLFGFILVLGVVVDDAIVVAENIHTTVNRSGPGHQSVIKGAKQVAMPVTFGVLTSMAAFIPILIIPGINGKLWSGIALVVIFCLFFSLVESKLILPAHLLNLSKISPKQSGLFFRMQNAVDDGLHRLIQKVYKPMLSIALHNRYTTVAIFIALIIITMGMWHAGFVRVVFFPEIEADTIHAELNMVNGSTLENRRKAIDRIENGAAKVNDDFNENSDTKKKIIKSLTTVAFNETRVFFYAELLPSEKRDVSSHELIKKWREKIGELPGIQSIKFQGVTSGGGSPIDFQLECNDEKKLRAAAIELKRQLAKYEGIYDIRDNLRQESRELRYRLKPEAEAMGITRADLARWVRYGYHGIKGQTLQRGRDEVDVMVRYPLSERSKLRYLEKMFVRTEKGRSVPFSELADLSWGMSDTEIQRSDRKRVINIMADVDKKSKSPTQVISQIKAEVMPDILIRYQGVKYKMAGEAKGNEETIKSLMRGTILILFVIYALMAIPLNSYYKPIIIMTAIPFGLVGAVWGHWIMRLPISLLSLCGIIALSGVVINDGLVMIDVINKKREQGYSLIESVATSGPDRFRAIMLTSITTFLGLFPMIVERSLQAQFLIPMSVSLGFGILFATLINLFLVPIIYLIKEDIDFGLNKFIKKYNEKLRYAYIRTKE